MPTENRSSNTEMLSVPKGYMLVERSIWTEQQVEAATACITRLKGVPTINDRALAMAAIDAAQCTAPDIELSDLLPPPQPHPEPMAWMVGTAFWWTREEAERDAAETGLPIVGLGPMTCTAEVERLRKACEAEFRSVETLNEDNQKLRAQLAEAQALLRQASKDALFGMTKVMIDDYLSASAEPSEERGSSHGFEQSPNTCRHDERSGVWWKEGSITRTGQECRACGNVQEDPVASAEPSAPVEIDERAEFELAYQRAADCGWTSTKMLSRRIWDARAALGRKPQVKP